MWVDFFQGNAFPCVLLNRALVITKSMTYWTQRISKAHEIPHQNGAHAYQSCPSARFVISMKPHTHCTWSTSISQFSLYVDMTNQSKANNLYSIPPLSDHCPLIRLENLTCGATAHIFNIIDFTGTKGNLPSCALCLWTCHGSSQYVFPLAYRSHCWTAWRLGSSININCIILLIIPQRCWFL